MNELKSSLQEEYCKQRVFEKKSQIESYKLSHPNAKKSSDDVIYTDASRLEHDPKVILRINELSSLANERVVKKYARDKEYMLKELDTIIDICQSKIEEICNEEIEYFEICKYIYLHIATMPDNQDCYSYYPAITNGHLEIIKFYRNKCEIFDLLPVMRLSTQMTSCPSAMNLSHR